MSTAFVEPTIEPVPTSAIEATVLDQLRARLTGTPRFWGPAAVGTPPVLWFRLHSRKDGIMLHDAVVHRRRVAVFPWGWDFTFGPMLTITLMAKGMAGPPPSACIPADDPAFALLENGRFIGVFAVGHEVVTCLSIDLSTMVFPPDTGQDASGPTVDDGRGFYRTQWHHVNSHVPILVDPLARYWESVFHRQVFKRFFTPAERLSSGWLETYRQEVRSFAAMLTNMRSTGSLNGVNAAQFSPCVQSLLDAAKSYDLGEIMGRYAGLHRELEKRPLFYLVEELGNFMQATADTPIYYVVRAAITLYMRSSEMTNCGRRLPWIDDQGQLQQIELNPAGWPPGTPIEEYWGRTPEWVAINAGRGITGDDFPADFGPKSPLVAQLPTASDIVEVKGSAEALMDEAAANKQWTIPPHAIVDLHVGPFRWFELTEVNDDVLIIARTADGYFVEMTLVPAKRFVSVPLGDSETAESQRAALTLVAAAIIRDFWVTEQRETVFATRTEAPGIRGPRSADAPATPRIVYLPRVRYTPHPDLERCERELSHAERRAHFVRAHFRRSEHASDLQHSLATRYGFALPQGYTFVKPHERGTQKRDVIYRSRSALQTLYTRVESTESSRPVQWFRFERDVRDLMATLGFEVQHVAASRRGDDGIDVFATKGSDLDLVNWVIQCKCYNPNRRVGPSVVRDMVGALAAHPRGTRGMIVTTSSFSQKAGELAETEGIRLMDGQEFAKKTGRL